MKRHCQDGRACFIDFLDDGCLLKVLSFLKPLPDRFNASRVSKRWNKLSGDERLWIKVKSSTSEENKEHTKVELRSQPSLLNSLECAVSVARPGDTIVLRPGVHFIQSAVIIDKPLCLLGEGETQEDTILISPHGCESALVFYSNARVSFLKIRAQMGSCLLHRSGKLTVENCTLECMEHPLEHLVCPILTTASAVSPLSHSVFTSREKHPILSSVASPSLNPSVENPLTEFSGASTELSKINFSKETVTVCPDSEFGKGSFQLLNVIEKKNLNLKFSKDECTHNALNVVETRIEGGNKAICILGDLTLNSVRVMYAKAALVFWFTASHIVC